MAASAALPISPWWLVRAGARIWRVAADEVVEVIPWPRLTPVPRAPAALLGITRHGDTIVPVFDPLLAAGEAGGMPLCVALLRGRVGEADVVFGLAAAEVVPGDATAAEPLDIARILAAVTERTQAAAPGSSAGRDLWNRSLM